MYTYIYIHTYCKQHDAKVLRINIICYLYMYCICVIAIVIIISMMIIIMFIIISIIIGRIQNMKSEDAAPR